MTDQTFPHLHAHSAPATIWQRVENAALAVAILLAMIVMDHPWWVLLAACWAFHVAVDRALGYGLKLGAFRHTHLGLIGRDAAA